ncbi:MAG: hypothetical protein ACYC6Y_10885 [Thermoguttaceae bacterium]
MPPTRLLVSLLILASLALDLVLLALLPGRNPWPDLFVAALLGVAGGQVNLATAWSVLGYRHLPARLAGAVLVPVGWALAIAVTSSTVLLQYRTAAAWAVHFLTHTAVLGALLLLFRLSGARLLEASFTAGAGPVRRFQFTLRYLFAWLTATALVLSALRTTFENVHLARITLDWTAILVLAFVNTMLGLASLWLIGDTRRLAARIVAASATALPAGCVVGGVLLVADPDRYLSLGLLWFVAGAYSAVGWLVLRVAGVRLLWPRSGSAAQGDRPLP